MSISPEEIIELYKEGRSDTEICRAIGITKRQFQKEYDRNSAWRALVDMGRDFAEAWWDEQWRTGVRNKDVNPNILKPVMQQRYGWADKTESKNANINAELTREQIVERLSQQLALTDEQVRLIAGQVTQEEPISDQEETDD